jgi:hypothetical protein
VRGRQVPQQAGTSSSLGTADVPLAQRPRLFNLFEWTQDTTEILLFGACGSWVCRRALGVYLLILYALYLAIIINDSAMRPARPPA